MNISHNNWPQIRSYAFLTITELKKGTPVNFPEEKVDSHLLEK